jgi:hypothetical protein
MSLKLRSSSCRMTSSAKDVPAATLSEDLYNFDLFNSEPRRYAEIDAILRRDLDCVLQRRLCQGSLQARARSPRAALLSSLKIDSRVSRILLLAHSGARWGRLSPSLLVWVLATIIMDPLAPETRSIVTPAASASTRPPLPRDETGADTACDKDGTSPAKTYVGRYLRSEHGPSPRCCPI